MWKTGARQREPPPHRLFPLPWPSCPAEEHCSDSLCPVSPDILHSEALLWGPSFNQPAPSYCAKNSPLVACHFNEVQTVPPLWCPHPGPLLYDFPFLGSLWAQFPPCGALSLELRPEMQNKEQEQGHSEPSFSSRPHPPLFFYFFSKDFSPSGHSYQKPPCSCLTLEHSPSCWTAPQVSVGIRSKASEVCNPSPS